MSTHLCNNGHPNGQPRLRDRLCLLIREHRFNSALVKAHAADYFGTPVLRETNGWCDSIYVFLCLAQRARTAFLAISRRRSGVSFAARTLPPLEPPILPRATACGFFFFVIAADTLSSNGTKDQVPTAT